MIQAIPLQRRLRGPMQLSPRDLQPSGVRGSGGCVSAQALGEGTGGGWRWALVFIRGLCCGCELFQA